MARLNQIIAVEKGIKSRVYSEVTELHKACQKPDLFNGFIKTYQRKDEDSEDLPPERKHVQFNVTDVLAKVKNATSELMDITARKDWTNCNATADVVVDGTVLIKGAPVTYLLFLEKQLSDMRAFIARLPILDEAEKWERDSSSGLFRSETTQTHRTKKTQRPIVLYPATTEHPAQTQLLTEDVIAGYWSQVKFSGAVPKPQKEKMAAKVEMLLIAVKQAREQANSADEATDRQNIGNAVFNFLLEE